ncbi:DUF1127 domain-containing protein [Oceanicella actignis]|uniref:Uncharacterized conserved protein YjiS, DUF1127 family n=1 Tax=Oceanicella actignis TaxID=1189325 RepID=A0A1M7SV69_9RHOB|nr:DUF1127 domain-containing protein [Oceanicella actignis]TYO90643.1 uncharacterized protein YjiS (DUF1127 family) [Oceanicella actignis]SES71860.1 Uncharacterized conserved protein YjiS, DUF1127 family [Oceanicella actignis]SHN62284.1 Uncharacterized conserved protein YjiS, DUF1127 family [Oceanicella actignis]
MAHVANNAPAVGASLASLVRAKAEELAARYAKWRLYRRTLRELSALDNRDLADLGLSRASLRSVAWHAVYDN